MNIIIVGFGNIGKHYLEILKNFKDIKKIFIIDKIKIKFLPKNCIQLDEKSLKNSINDIHYAIICSPTGLHYKHASYFLKNKIPTLIEKPLTITTDEATKLINLKKEKKVKCWVAFQNRHNLAVNKSREILKKKKFGKPFFVDSALFWQRSKEYYKSSNWRGKYSTDGGVLFNQAVHLLDALVYNFGPVTKFNAFAGFNKKKLQAEDLITINFIHKNNIISNLKATTRANNDYRMSMDVLCENGRFLIKDISLNKIFYFKKDSIKEDKKNSENFTKGLGPKSGMGNGHKKILKEFLNPKIFKSSKNLDIEKNIYIVKLVNSIYNSLFTKKNYNTVSNKNFKT